MVLTNTPTTDMPNRYKKNPSNAEVIGQYGKRMEYLKITHMMSPEKVRDISERQGNNP